MNDFSIQLSERIVLSRRLRKLTQAELSERSGLSQAHISKLESKKISDPGIGMIMSICNGLSIPVSLMLEGSMDELISHLEKPLDSNWGKEIIESPTGIVYGQSLATGKPIIIDRFDKTEFGNPNQIIFGTTGSGKSYTAKLQLMQYALLGKPFAVIDPFSEYTNIIDKTKGALGTVIKLGDGKYHLNPLDFTMQFPSYKPLAQMSSKELDFHGDFISAHMPFLERFFASLYRAVRQKPISKEANIILQRTILDTYKRFGYSDKASQLTATSNHMPILSDIRSELAQLRRSSLKSSNKSNFIEIIEDLIFVLDQSISPSMLGDIIDWPTDLPKDVVNTVFTIARIDSIELDPLLTMLLTQYISARVCQQEPFENKDGQIIPKPKYNEFYLYIDEAQRFSFCKNSMAVLGDLVRTSRKFNCSITLVSANLQRFTLLEDGVSPNRDGRLILINCSTKILMKQLAEDETILVDVFKISREQAQKIIQFGVGEYFAQFGRIDIWGTFNNPES